MMPGSANTVPELVMASDMRSTTDATSAHAIATAGTGNMLPGIRPKMSRTGFKESYMPPS